MSLREVNLHEVTAAAQQQGRGFRTDIWQEKGARKHVQRYSVVSANRMVPQGEPQE